MNDDSPAQAPAASPPSELPKIGEDGAPIRVLSFSGGGFSTAMQLGVAHALIVSRRKAPDMVIGSSGGAINAVALAEIYQAGAGLSGSARWSARLSRLRGLYRAYTDAPGLIVQKYTPDHFQTEIEQPLKPQDLPIHTKEEKQHRAEATRAKAGLMNLYNTLIDTSISLSTLTLGVRRILGIRQALGSPRRLARWAGVAVEFFQLWNLLGRNLWRLAPLVPHYLGALVKRQPRNTKGTTAAGIVFGSRVWRFGFGLVSRTLCFFHLGAIWGLAAIIMILPHFLVGRLALACLPANSADSTKLIAVPLTGSLVIAGLVAISAEDHLRSFWRSVRSSAAFMTMLACWYILFTAPCKAVFGLIDGRFDPTWLIDTLLDAPALPHCVLAIGMLILALVNIVITSLRRQRLAGDLLKQFSINASLFNAQPIRDLLIRLIDPEYYGEPEMGRLVENALGRASSLFDNEGHRARAPKTFDAYSNERADPPIHVAATAANVGSGRVVVLDRSVPVVDGLLASVSVAPFLPAVMLETPRGSEYYIDGGNFSNEPTRPLFSHLRKAVLVNRESSAVHIFSVSPLPYSKTELGDPRVAEAGRDLSGLIAIALRARELERFRDAALERRLTELQTRTMPSRGSVVLDLVIPSSDGSGRKETLFRTWVFPIEPEQPLRVNERVLGESSPEGRKSVVSEAIADGCRVTLQRIFSDELGKPAAAGSPVRCWDLMARFPSLGDPARLAELTPPAHSSSSGPGLPEICSHCWVFLAGVNALPADSARERAQRTLIVPPAHERQPSPGKWPSEFEVDTWQEPDELRKPRLEGPPPAPDSKWPVSRSNPNQVDRNRSTVSFLFSGGVFRGVFQVGVLNGLSEAGLKPDVVAGASVGSIMAAMAAATFASSAHQTPLQKPPLPGGGGQILKVASTFLAIDRLVLTDRFSNFIRGFTVRAAGTRFSLRQFDRVFRRYDGGRLGTFGSDCRSVLAGLERLTYITPLEQLRILEALKTQQYSKALGFLRSDFQNWLDRAGVGLEVLGAEPLRLLISELVLPNLTQAPGGKSVDFKSLLDRGIAFLATATNLTAGRLEILGSSQLSASDQTPDLLEGLLASSAFPGVFRPRQIEEVVPSSRSRGLIIDGGVMDNLPLDAVAQFLHQAATHAVIPARPEHPHLLICASLQEKPDPILDDKSLSRIRESWPLLSRRAKRLGYNDKLSVFRRVQKNIRAIVDAREGMQQSPIAELEWTPLNLDVLPIIPNWLCGTFAFHPMLGFREKRQAESIAHGCRTTLFALRDKFFENPDAARVWGINSEKIPPAHAKPEAPEFGGSADAGQCWWRNNCLCPFSKTGQKAAGFSTREESRTQTALDRIHSLCLRPETHTGS